MFLPRFSIRWLLLFVGVCAVGSLVLRAAWIGEPWGGGALVGLGFIGLTLLVHAIVFVFLWPLSLIAQTVLGRSRGSRPTAPNPMTSNPTTTPVSSQDHPSDLKDA